MKKNHMPFSILFLIYAGAGVISLVAFGMNGSYLSRRQETPAAAAAEPEISTDPVEEPTEQPADDPVEAPTETPIEAPVENPDDTLAPDTPEPEEISETPDPVTEPADETDASDSEETADPEKNYYAFTVIDGVTNVRIRETDARDSQTVSHIDGGKSGYVLEKGDSRSKILTKKGTVGYIYNEYITISEIPKDEFPEEYR